MRSKFLYIIEQQGLLTAEPCLQHCFLFACLFFETKLDELDVASDLCVPVDDVSLLNAEVQVFSTVHRSQQG